jgi:hypothetical protein
MTAIPARHLMCPGDLKDHDANVIGGAITAHTALGRMFVSPLINVFGRLLHGC